MKQRRSLFSLIALLAAVALLTLPGVGCKKRAPVPPPTPPAARTPAPELPTIHFTASPETIANGESSTLSWSTTDATGVIIENIGSFPTQGSTVVTPTTSTTYTATATGPGGSRTAQVRVTVTGEAAGGVQTTQPEVTEQPLSVDEIFKSEIHDVFFDFDRYELTPEAKDILRRDADVLNNKIPDARILIEGHCDERGTEEYNLALGDKRANAVKEYLVTLGVSPSRIQTISYGEERPFDPAHNEEAWAKNRRAHFVLIK